MVLFGLFNLHQGKPCIPTIHSYNINLMTRYTTLAHHFAIYIVLSEFETHFLRTYLPAFLLRLLQSQFLMADITWYFNSCLLWLMYIPFESASRTLSLIEPAHSIEVFRIWLIVLRLRLQTNPLSLANSWSHLTWIWYKLDLRNTWFVKVAKIVLLSSPSFRSFYTSFLVLRAARTLSNSVKPTSHGIYTSPLLFIMVSARGPAHLVFALLVLFSMFLNLCIEELIRDFIKRARTISSNDPYISHILACYTGTKRPTRLDISNFILNALRAFSKQEHRRSESDSILLEIMGHIGFLFPVRTLCQFWNDRTAEARVPDYSSKDDLIRDKHAGSEAFGSIGLASLIERVSDGTLAVKPFAWNFWFIVFSILSPDGHKEGFERKAQWTSRVCLRALTESRLKDLSMGLRYIGPSSSWKKGNPVSCIPLNRASINSKAAQHIEVVWADVFSKTVREVDKIRGPWVNIGLEPYMYFDVLRQPRIPDGEKRLWLALECRLPRCSFPRHHLSQMSVFLSLYMSGRFLFLEAHEPNDVVHVSRIGRDLYMFDRADKTGADIFHLDEDIFGSNISIDEHGSMAVIFSSREEIKRAKKVASDLIERGIYEGQSREPSSYRRQAVNIYVGRPEEEAQLVLRGRHTTVEYRIRCESNAELNGQVIDEPRFVLSSCPEQTSDPETDVRTNLVLRAVFE